MIEKNLITKEDLDLDLKSHYDYFSKKYGENHILGVFMVGLANYGFAEYHDPVPYNIKVLYLPSFEELCTGKPIHYKRGPIEIIDIRHFYNIVTAEEQVALELLFCPCLINKKYRRVFEDCFINKREQIGKFNIRYRLIKIQSVALKYLTEKNNDFAAMRLYYAAKHYFEGDELDKCFHLTDEMEELWEYKYKKRKIKDIKEYLYKFDMLIHEADDESSAEVDNMIKKGIITLMTKALDKNTSVETFFNIATKKEVFVLKAIKEVFGDQDTGLLNISKMVEDYGISRPVFSNVFVKLKESGLAEVTNRGVKGTEIRFKETFNIKDYTEEGE